MFLSIFFSLFTTFPESQVAPGQVEYPDDFEEAEAGEEYEADAALAAPRDDALEEEFQLCDAGGLTITLRALKENGWSHFDLWNKVTRGAGGVKHLLSALFVKSYIQFPKL